MAIRRVSHREAACNEYVWAGLTGACSADEMYRICAVTVSRSVILTAVDAAADS